MIKSSLPIRVASLLLTLLTDSAIFATYEQIVTFSLRFIPLYSTINEDYMSGVSL